MATANEIIAKARAEIGTAEKYNNNVKYNTEYYGHSVNGSAYPWCAVFVWWVFKECGASKLYYGGDKSAYCPTLVSYYKSKKQWYSSPKVGDIVFYNFSKGAEAKHVGIVTGVYSTYITAVEGNTSGSNNTDGGSVQERQRSLSYCIGFARPAYSVTKVAEVQAQASTTNMAYTAIVTTNTQNLNVRKGAGAGRARVTELAKGSTVIIDKESNGWARLAGFTNPELWVSKEWITKK